MKFKTLHTSFGTYDLGIDSGIGKETISVVSPNFALAFENHNDSNIAALIENFDVVDAEFIEYKNSFQKRRTEFYELVQNIKVGLTSSDLAHKCSRYFALKFASMGARFEEEECQEDMASLELISDYIERGSGLYVHSSIESRAHQLVNTISLLKDSLHDIAFYNRQLEELNSEYSLNKLFLE